MIGCFDYTFEKLVRRCGADIFSIGGEEGKGKGMSYLYTMALESSWGDRGLFMGQGGARN